VFGYNYDENIRRYAVWAQAQFALPRWQFFAAGETGQTRFWRTGHYQNGAFPDNSLGDSPTFSFQAWGAKAGAVFKINGRNYLYANGYAGTRAPQFRDVFLQPRVSNLATPDVETYKTRSVEGGYQLRSPYYRGRITAFLTDFLDETEAYTALASSGNFGSIRFTNVDRRHAGVEVALEAKPITGWTLTAAGLLGRYLFTSRQLAYLIDDQGVVYNFGDTAYVRNYYVPRTPQTAFTAAIKYESRQFWFATLSFNWADNFWFDFDRTRRTSEAVVFAERDSPLWHTLLDQKKAPSAYTLDFFGGKSWRLRDGKYYLYLNAGINNLLDNQEIITTGRDSYASVFRDRDDARLYQTEVQYAFGLNYFVSLAFRM
jgi:hypothetical protein